MHDTEIDGNEGPIRAGVIGVGNMGRHHARVYSELPDVELVGVNDADAEIAAAVAEDNGTTAMGKGALLTAADVVSVAVPTRYHCPIARECIEQGVHVLVEKPFVEDLDDGRELVRLARQEGVTLQVGHVERFNPAVQAIQEIVPDLDVIAVEASRLGPPIDREMDGSVVTDLMVHDIDVLLSLVDQDIEGIDALSARDDQYVTAQFSFSDDVVARLTASRVTQQKVRELSITAEDCRVNVDYIDRTVHIHRHSLPEYVEGEGNFRYRHESIVERPTVENGEPLKRELSAFVDAVRSGDRPVVTGEDGLNVCAIAQRIDDIASDERRTEEVILR